MKRLSLFLIILINFLTSAFGFSLRQDLPKAGKTDVVYKQTQTGDENYFLHIKNVYVALPDLTKLFQSIGEHTTFEISRPSYDEDSDCKGPYCNEVTDFFASGNKVPTSAVEEESSDVKPTEATSEDETKTEKDSKKPEIVTVKNDNDVVDVVESTTFKINSEVHVVQQQKLPSSGNTHEIFIPVQVMV